MKYRKKPVVVDAVRWTGDIESLGKIEKFQGFSFSKDEVVDIVKSDVIRMYTPKGEITASLGDYIIRDANGGIYPCKPDIFEETYEMIEDDEMSVAEEMWRKTRR